MENLTMYNGNNQRIEKELPKIVILSNNINNTALEYIADNTNLHFKNITIIMNASLLKQVNILDYF